MSGLWRAFNSLMTLVRLGWVRELCRLLRLLIRQPADDPRDDRDRRRSPYPCVPVNRPEMLRPDPLIYSQYFLMQQGLAVTWDNPDISLRKGGVEVSSSSLEPGAEYEIVARIWNASPTCPVVSMPVYFSYLSFGVGTQSNSIDKTYVDLGVQGGPGSPAFATVPWRTPADPGHYCIQVRLDPPDDVNFDNNLGQENTNVAKARSPARFEFQLRNATEFDQRYRFIADAYRVPRPDPCGSNGNGARRDPGRRLDMRRQGFQGPRLVDQARIAPHALETHPLPEGWTVACTPDSPTLVPAEEITVSVDVSPPDDFRGTLAINVNAYNATGLAGGVTLSVVTE